MFICKSRQRHTQWEGRIFKSWYHQLVALFEQQTGHNFFESLPLEEAGHWTNNLMRQVFADICGLSIYKVDKYISPTLKTV